MSETHTVEFVPSGRGKARCAANPDYPDGIELDVSGAAAKKCAVAIPYPAPECGHYLVKCRLCRFSVALTAAGRLDDPTKITIPCNLDASLNSNRS